jgi:hypothetical protein
MKLFKGSWKTTSAGLMMILTVVIHLGFAIYNKTLTENMLIIELPTLFGGIGLAFARDNNKSSTDVGIVPKDDTVINK